MVRQILKMLLIKTFFPQATKNVNTSVAKRDWRALGTEQVVSSIPGSVGYISYSMFIEPRITWVPSGFSEYIWLDTKIVFKKIYINIMPMTWNISCIVIIIFASWLRP